MIKNGSIGGFQSGFKGGEGVGLPVFMPKIKAGSSLVDMVTGVNASCAIPGIRYGIVNGSVTAFAANQPAIEDNGLRACPAFTQLAQKTEDLSTWTKVASTVSVDGSIMGVNRLFIADTKETGAHYVEKTTPFGSVSDNSYTNISCIAKYNGRNLRLFVLTKNNLTKTIFFNLKNGNIYSQESDTFSSIIPIGNGYYSCFFSVLHGTGATTIASNILLTDDSFNTSYAGDISKGIFISKLSYTNTSIPLIPPYVPNNTTGSISVVSEAATPTTGTSFDLDNALLARLKTALRWPNAQGHIELTFKSNTDSSWWANSSVYNILSVNNTAASLLYINKDSGGAVTFRATDGTNVSSLTQGLTVGSTYKISVDWGTYGAGQKIRITVNGVKSSLVDCGVSLGAEDLRFFDLSTIHIGWIVKDSLKLFERPRW